MIDKRLSLSIELAVTPKVSETTLGSGTKYERRFLIQGHISTSCFRCSRTFQT